MKVVRLSFLAAAAFTVVVAFAAPAAAHAGTATCLSSGLTRVSNDDPHSGVVTLNDGRHLSLPGNGHVDFSGPPATTFSIVWSDQFSQGSRNLPANCVPATTTTTHASTTTTVAKTTTTQETTTSTTVPDSTSLPPSTEPSTSSAPSTTVVTTTTSSSSSTLPESTSTTRGVTSSTDPATTTTLCGEITDTGECFVLPVTGFPAGLVAAIAVVAVLAGIVIVVSARNRASKAGRS